MKFCGILGAANSFLIVAFAVRQRIRMITAPKMKEELPPAEPAEKSAQMFFELSHQGCPLPPRYFNDNYSLKSGCAQSMADFYYAGDSFSPEDVETTRSHRMTKGPSPLSRTFPEVALYKTPMLPVLRIL